jgi:hypothetical protein
VTPERVGLPDWAGDGLRRRAGESLPEFEGEPLLLLLGDGTQSLGTSAPRSTISGDGQHRCEEEELSATSVVSVGLNFLLCPCSKGVFFVEWEIHSGADRCDRMASAGKTERARREHLLS